MTPFQFLLLTASVSAAALGAAAVFRLRRHRQLSALARDWRMHYSERDVFRLIDHVPSRLPGPGAAKVNVIYGIEGEFHRYIFSVEYTTGLVHRRSRIVRVASFREPKGRSSPSLWSPLEVAELHLPLVEQYRSLRARQTGPPRGESGIDASRSPG
jgi:hypothetical protein